MIQQKLQATASYLLHTYLCQLYLRNILVLEAAPFSLLIVRMH